MTLVAGGTGCVQRVVTPADTAAQLGSGDVEVLATPRVLAWLEAATLAVVGAELAETQTTVGVSVQLQHTKPSAVGQSVEAHARLERVEGRRLHFAVWLLCAGEQTAAGSVERVIVDRARFPAAPR